MRDPQLRRATLADVAHVRAVTRGAYAKWVPLIGREPLPMRANFERAVADHVIDLWEEDGKLLALIEMIPEGTHLLIENIAVLPECQGQGLGDKLLRHAGETARALGLGEMRLYTNAAFVSNVTFYAKRGFSEYLREAIPTGGVVVHMRKVVATSS